MINRYIKSTIITLSLILAFTLCSIGICTYSVDASEGLTLKMGALTTGDNGTYSVPVMLENNTGVAGVSFMVTYDASKLKITGVDTSSSAYKSPMINSAGTGTIKYLYVSLSDSKENGTLFVINFKSVSTAATDVTFTITNADLCTSEPKSIKTNVVNGTYNISAGDAETTGNNKETSAIKESNSADNSGTESSNNNSNNNNSQEGVSTEAEISSGTKTETNTETNSETGTKAENNSDDNNTATWIILGAIGIMVVICGAMALMVFKKK